MIKAKVTVTFKVPAWPLCNHDGTGWSGKTQKDLCRFCRKTPQGYICTLFNKGLAPSADNPKHVNKCSECYEMSLTCKGTSQEPELPEVDPKELVATTLSEFTHVVRELENKGYPRRIAEATATKYLLEDK